MSLSEVWNFIVVGFMWVLLVFSTSLVWNIGKYVATWYSTKQIFNQLVEQGKMKEWDVNDPNEENSKAKPKR